MLCVYCTRTYDAQPLVILASNCEKIIVCVEFSLCNRRTKSVFPLVSLCKLSPTGRQDARTIVEFRLKGDKDGPTLSLRMQNACDGGQRCREEKTSGVECSLDGSSARKRVGLREQSNRLIAVLARTFTRIGAAVASSSSSSFSSFSSSYVRLFI